MRPFVFVSFVQQSVRAPGGQWFRECVVEMPSPIDDPFHIAELRALVSERMGTEAAAISIVTWRRLEDAP